MLCKLLWEIKMYACRKGGINRFLNQNRNLLNVVGVSNENDLKELI